MDTAASRGRRSTRPPSAGDDVDRSVYRHRMKDLCEATGLDRQAIHFYIQQGLLPPGRKTGRNMAFYTEDHLARLQLIKKLQHERFLPLKAIKALLDGREERFTPAQHRFLGEVRERLGEELVPSVAPMATVDVEDLLARTSVDREDLERAKELGIVATRADEDGRERVAEDDAWLFELIGQMRTAGFSRELGFTADDIAFYEEAVDKLFGEEMRLISSRLSHLPPDDVARMIERGLPVIHALIVRYHAAKIRDFFGSMG
jgi:DNA-binding transcriptional MerR regulator